MPISSNKEYGWPTRSIKRPTLDIVRLFIIDLLQALRHAPSLLVIEADCRNSHGGLLFLPSLR